MKKYTNKCYVIRSLPLMRDSRLQRYGKFLEEDVINVTWEDNDTSRKLIKLGRKDYPLFLSYPLLVIRLFLMGLFSISKNDKVICMDLDTYLPVKLGTLFRSIDVYFDIVDPISQTRFRKVPFSFIFDYIEYFCLKYSRKIILPGESRVTYYKDRLSVNVSKIIGYSICENVPVITELAPKASSRSDTSSRFTLGYFGSLDETRGILELINFFKNRTDINIVIAGMGELETKIKEMSKVIDNLSFIGKYKPDEIQGLYSLVDFVWAYYSPDVYLHKYACPNKYYEHLAFKVPIIVNKIVPQSQEIIKMNTGIVIDDALNNNCFEKLDSMIINYDLHPINFGKWEEHYSNYCFSLI